jgi:large subunit ribosomal protein L25
MNEIVLEAEKREATTRGLINVMRRNGRIPGIAYGAGKEPMALSVEEKHLQRVIHSERGRNALISLKVAGTSHPVLIKEIQRHAITRAILHVDFHRVSLKQKVEASVPVRLKGEAPGAKLSGGVLEHLIREVKVTCLPTEIPPALDADVSALQIGDSLKVKDLKIPTGVELLDDPEGVMVSVVSPTILEEPTVEAAAAPEAAVTEPEVIKKGKVEEGAEAAAAPAADKKAAPAAATATPPPKGGGAKPEAKKP